MGILSVCRSVCLSVGLDDAAYAKVWSHFGIPVISAQNYAPEMGEPQESPFPLDQY
jgi:hypothetical protein